MAYISFPRSGGSRAGFKAWPLLLFAVFGIYYYFSNQATVPITGRSQIVGLNPREEAALGLQSYNAILDQSKVVKSGPEVELVRQVGRQIARATGTTNFEWEFNVIHADQVNAFCLPGGKVAVYTGILPVAKNPDGLAVIIGHEVAHAIARHGAERMAHQQLAQFGQLAMGMAVSEMDHRARQGLMAAFGVGTQFGVLLPFSRKHESEADLMGLHYVAKSCYNPEEAPLLWERMGQAAKSRAAPPEFVSTHPSHDTRIQQFREWMPEALALRAKHCGGR